VVFPAQAPKCPFFPISVVCVLSLQFCYVGVLSFQLRYVGVPSFQPRYVGVLSLQYFCYVGVLPLQFWLAGVPSSKCQYLGVSTLNWTCVSLPSSLDPDRLTMTLFSPVCTGAFSVNRPFLAALSAQGTLYSTHQRSNISLYIYCTYNVHVVKTSKLP
jgi:hypothetical protein